MTPPTVTSRMASAIKQADPGWLRAVLAEHGRERGAEPLTVHGLADALLDVAEQAEASLPYVTDHARAEATYAIVGGYRALAFALAESLIPEPEPGG